MRTAITKWKSCAESERRRNETIDTFLSAKLEQKKKKKENPIEKRDETRLVKHILRISIYFIYNNNNNSKKK